MLERKRLLVLACVCAAFCVSGASALAFETLWFDQAGLAFGNDVWASSCVLSAFMLGMATGHLAAARFARRVARLRAFAALEATAAVTGVAAVFALGAIEPLFGGAVSGLFDDAFALNATRVLCALLVLLVPSAAMGASLPALTGALASSREGYGPVLGLLYGVNTAGGVIGVLSAESFFVPRFGLHAAALFAGAAQIAVALVAFVAGRPSSAPAPTPADEEVLGERRAPWLVCTFVAGALLLALEVVWLRVLTLFVDDTSSAFAAILAVVLAAIALGGGIGAVWTSRRRDAHRFAPRVAYGCGVAGVVSYLVYAAALNRFYVPEAPPSVVALIAAPLVAPVALGSGVLFALVGSGIRRTVGSGVVATSFVAAINTLGGAVGSLLAGFVLLPWLGMECALFVLLASYGMAGSSVSFAVPARPRLRFGELAVFAALLAVFPFVKARSRFIERSAGRWMRKGDRIVEVREARTGTLVHIRHEFHGLPICDQIVTNAYSMTSNDFLARRYMKFFVYLPVAVEPRVSKALLLGYGMGNTAKALVDTKEVERIDVVDVSSDMLDMSRSVAPQRIPEPLDDPRVHVHLGDARYFLRSTDEEYDLITGEPPPPVMAHVVSLYTKEYFELIRDRLRAGGMVTYWLPTMNLSARSARSLIAAFCDAFSNCSLWNGARENFVLVGTRGPLTTVDDARFAAQWREKDVLRELQSVGFEHPTELGATFIGDADYLKALTRDDLPLEDDFPKRIAVKGDRDERLALVGQWRDTTAARDRFRNSALVAEMFPPMARRFTLSLFENQRLFNDLTFSGPTKARQLTVLKQVLWSSPVHVQALLLLGSDPDFQRAIALDTADDARDPALAKHRIAGALAARNMERAKELVRDAPDSAIVLPGLREYVDDFRLGDAAAGERPAP
ncbi:MAG TPA: fused MFS/spermidine synthase [Polyangiaceae bacterium]|nr:fused MFS/spermidine synthase [Polyangiaceae bacterium]